jgi:plastocyanin domain-containing protein
MSATYLFIELAFVVAGFVSFLGYQHFASLRKISIRLDAGEAPQTIFVRRGERLRLRLLRATERDCANEVVFPALQIRKALPVGKPVSIDLRPASVGAIDFFCGMNMLRGTLEVRPQL